MSSGNIFGDDDDFELLPGGDTVESSSASKPAAKPPVAPRPARTGNAGLPTVGNTRPATNANGSRGLPANRPTGNAPRPVSSSSAASKQDSGIPSIPTPPRRVTPAKSTETESVPQVETPRSTLPTRRTPAPAPKPEPVAEPEPVLEDYDSHTGDADDYTDHLNTVTPAQQQSEASRNYDKKYEQNILAEQEERERAAAEALAYEDFKDRYNDDAADEVRRPNKQTSTSSIRTFETDGEEEDNGKESKRGGKNSRNQKKPAAKKPRGKKNGKNNDSDEDKQKTFAGGRKNVLVVRIVALSLVALLSGLGVKSIVAPPKMPGPSQVISAVKGGLGITQFPAENGKAFVTEFTKIYLTVDPAANKSAAKKKMLENFTSPALATDVSLAFTETDKQTVDGTPVVTNIESLDDNNAVYTVGAQVDGGSMLYLEVPVYYDLEKKSYSIAGLPSFVAPPVLAELPPVEEQFSDDPKIASEVKENVKGFFKEWGASSPELSLYTDAKATVEASTGLKGALVFEDISGLKVEKKDPAVDTDLSTRKATVGVTWKDPSKGSTLKYKQNYDLVLIRDDNKKWFIQDIKGAVRTNAG